MNEFERREAKRNNGNRPEKGMQRAIWIYTGLAIALFLLINFGIDPIRSAVVTTPESLLWWESMFIVSVLLVCTVALWVFYVIKIIKEYKEKSALPPKFWSAWGIVKKVIAVILTVLVVFVFVKNLSNTIYDVNQPPVEKVYYVGKIDSESENVATFHYTEEAEDYNHSDHSKNKFATCYLYNGLDLKAQEVTFRVFERSNMLVAIRNGR